MIPEGNPENFVEVVEEKIDGVHVVFVRVARGELILVEWIVSTGLAHYNEHIFTARELAQEFADNLNDAVFEWFGSELLRLEGEEK